MYTLCFVKTEVCMFVRESVVLADAIVRNY